MDAHEWKILGFVSAPIIGLYAWFLKHVTSSNRHPKGEDLVYREVCDERGKANDAEHQHLKEGIDELKVDVRTGFHDLKELIKNNH